MHKHPPEMEGLADCQGTNKWPNAFILEKQNRQIAYSLHTGLLSKYVF
jgi:hypothetical protein